MAGPRSYEPEPLGLDTGMRLCETLDTGAARGAQLPNGHVVACEWDPNHVGVVGMWYSSSVFR